MHFLSSRRARVLGAATATFVASVLSVAAAPSVASAEPFTYVNVSTGYHAACAVTSTGEGVCWGWNNQRSLGTTDTSEKVATPSRVSLPNGERFSTIDAGEYFTTCGLSTTGNAYCWGQHHLGSYFSPTSTSPVRVELPAGVTATQISNGSTIACAIDTDGQLWCWGDVLDFGNGSTEATRIPERVPMPDGASVASIDNGPTHSCAITSARHLYCWGSNDDGEMGLGYATLKVSMPVSPRIPVGVVPASVSAGLNRTCMLDTTGTGWCWGDNYNGSFGDGTYADSYVPVQMAAPGGEALTSLTTAWYHSCGTVESGTTFCWGRGDYGELGTGTTLGGKTFRQPVLPADVRLEKTATGLATTCAIDNVGRVWCWTGSDWGVSGTGDLTKSLFPRLIAPIGTPSVVPGALSSISAESAVASVTVNPNGAVTSVAAEVSLSPDFSGARRVAASSPITSGLYTRATLAISLGSLTPRADHWVRFIVTNQWGAVTSPATSFRTLGSEPMVSAAVVDEIVATRARVTLTIDPGLLDTTAHVEVARDADFSNARTVPLPMVGKTSPATSVSATVTGLAPRASYWVRAVATNRLGTSTSVAMPFNTVGDAPSISGLTVATTASAVTVSARVNGGLLSGTVHAELFPDPPSLVSQVSAPVAFDETENPYVSFTFGSLEARTTYSVRIISTNALGTALTDLVPARTRGGLPVIGDVSITDTSVDTASVLVRIDATGIPTRAKIQVATDPSFSSNLDEHFVGLLSGEGTVSRAMALNGLDRHTTYHVRVVASNAAGTVISGVATFTTLSPVGVEINNGDETTTDTRVTASFTYPAGAVGVRISDNAGMRLARVLDRVDSVSWDLSPSTDAEAERFVFVQFLFESGRSSAVFGDSITLVLPDDVEPSDETAPEITDARVVRVTSAAVGTGASGRRMRVTGRDSFSGITAIQVRHNGKVRTTKVPATRLLNHVIASPARTGVWVRVIDASGNASKWRKVSPG